MTDLLESDPAGAPQRPSRGRAALLRWGRFCILASTVAIVLAEIAGRHWPILLITPYTPQWAAVAILGTLILLLMRWNNAHRRRWDQAWLIVGILTAAWASAITLGLIPWRIAPSAPSVTPSDPAIARVKVLAANVHTSNINYSALLELIRTESPDIILLMEINTRWMEALKDLSERYPHRRTVPDDLGNFGMGLWTRLEVDDAQLVLMQADQAEVTLLDVPQVVADLRVPGAANPTASHRIRFIGLHPLPPMTPSMSRSRDAVLARAADRVKEANDTPAIVAGDFNLTRYCRMFRTMSTDAGLRDATSSIKFTWPNTWSRWIMGIRIDHTLVNDAWRVVEVRSGPDIGSDHLPVITTLQLVRPAP